MLILLRLMLAMAVAATLAFALMSTPPVFAGLEADPVKHAAGLLVVTTLAGLAYPRCSVLLLLVIVGTASGLLEYVQDMPPFVRDPDLADWQAGMVGAVAGAALVLVVRLLWRAAKYIHRSLTTPSRQPLTLSGTQPLAD